MSTATSRVTRQGQISVPAAVRRRFGIVPGTVLEWYESEGRLCVRAKQLGLDEVNELLRPFVNGPHQSLADLRAAKVRHAVQKAASGRG